MKSDFLYDDGSVYVSGLVEILNEENIGKIFNADEAGKMINTIETLLNTDVYLDEIHTDPYDKVKMYKMYCDRMVDDDEIIVITTEIKDDEIEIITEIGAATWQAYR